MNAKFAANLFLLTGVLLTSGCATVKTHPDFTKKHEHMQKLSLTPPDVEAYEITFNAGAKPLADLKSLVEKSSSKHFEEVLKDKGYDVTAVPIDQAQLDQDPRLKEAWFEMQTLYKQALQDIQKNKKPGFTYEIGAGPNYFAEKYHANAVVLIRQRGTKLSDGMIASQVAANVASIATTLLVGVSAGGGVQPWRTLQTEVALVDADSGDILWYNIDQTVDDYTKPENDKVILAHIKKILGALPDSKLKPKKPAADKKADKPSQDKKGSANFAAQKPVSVPISA